MNDISFNFCLLLLGMISFCKVDFNVYVLSLLSLSKTQAKMQNYNSLTVNMFKSGNCIYNFISNKFFAKYYIHRNVTPHNNKWNMTFHKWSICGIIFQFSVWFRIRATDATALHTSALHLVNWLGFQNAPLTRNLLFIYLSKTVNASLGFY